VLATAVSHLSTEQQVELVAALQQAIKSQR